MKVLIVKTSSLGDVIQCFPALDFLKRTFPGVEIDWLVEKASAPLLRAHPYVHQVLEVEIKKWKKNLFRPQNWKEAYVAFKKLKEKNYDIVYDFQGNLKSGLLLSQIKSPVKIGFERDQAPEWPNSFFTTKRIPIDKGAPISSHYLTLAQGERSHSNVEATPLVKLSISEEETKWVKGQLKEGLKMMVCLGSNWENKKLSLKTWEAFLTKVESTYSPFFYFVAGNEKEKREVERLHTLFPERSATLPLLSLPVWQHMMAHMDIVFTVDSSALHLAATTPTATFSFFGPSSPQVYKPQGKNHGYFQGTCPYGQSFVKRCPKLRSCESGACLKSVFPDSLFKEFSTWFEG